GAHSVFRKTRTITAPWTGTLVAAGGHLHDGGIDLTLKQINPAKVLCRAVAHYDMPEPTDFPSSISACSTAQRVTGGKRYNLIARYDNSMPHMAVMGIMLAYVWRGTA